MCNEAQAVTTHLFRTKTLNLHLRLTKSAILSHFCTLFGARILRNRHADIANAARRVDQFDVPRLSSPRAALPNSACFTHFFATFLCVQKLTE